MKTAHVRRRRGGVAPNPELVTNGTFDSDTSGWNDGPNISSAAVGGVAQVSRSGTITPSDAFTQTVAVTTGETYTLEIDVVTDNGAAFAIVTGGGGFYTGLGPQVFGSTGTFSWDIVAEDGEIKICLWTDDGTTSAFDNISLKLA